MLTAASMIDARSQLAIRLSMFLSIDIVSAVFRVFTSFDSFETSTALKMPAPMAMDATKMAKVIVNTKRLCLWGSCKVKNIVHMLPEKLEFRVQLFKHVSV